MASDGFVFVHLQSAISGEPQGPEPLKLPVSYTVGDLRFELSHRGGEIFRKQVQKNAWIDVFSLGGDAKLEDHIQLASHAGPDRHLHLLYAYRRPALKDITRGVASDGQPLT